MVYTVFKLISIDHKLYFYNLYYIYISAVLGLLIGCRIISILEEICSGGLDTCIKVGITMNATLFL